MCSLINFQAKTLLYQLNNLSKNAQTFFLKANKKNHFFYRMFGSSTTLSSTNSFSGDSGDQRHSIEVLKAQANDCVQP